MTPAPTPPPADPFACASTPAAARALLAILLAPLHAFIEARLAALFARLEDMLVQWRNGTLPPPPAERPRANRPATARAAATPLSVPHADEPWFARLVALATSDRAPEPRLRRTRAIPPVTSHARVPEPRPRPARAARQPWFTAPESHPAAPSHAPNPAPAFKNCQRGPGKRAP